jgi:opacity protein-like surface antigen
MVSRGISALAAALALGLVAPAAAEDWTGLSLTFGISATNGDLGEERPFFVGTTEVGEISPYAAVAYDWAAGDLTLGVVGDLELLQIESGDFLSAGKGFQGETDWFATLRGRVGMPLNDKIRVHASAGLALLRAGGQSNFILGPIADPAEAQVLTGTAVRVGMDYALSPKGALSVEYLYSDFGQSDDYNTDTSEPGRLDPYHGSLRLGYTLRF